MRRLVWAAASSTGSKSRWWHATDVSRRLLRETVKATSGGRYLNEAVRGSRDLLWRRHAVRAASGGDGVQEIEVACGRCVGNERRAISGSGSMRSRQLVWATTSSTGGKWWWWRATETSRDGGDLRKTVGVMSSGQHLIEAARGRRDRFGLRQAAEPGGKW